MNVDFPRPEELAEEDFRLSPSGQPYHLTPPYVHGEKWDLRFLELAKTVSGWSKDPSTQTGAVLVDDDKRILSVGFNGFPKGMGDNEKRYANRDEKYSRVVHCEVNALIFAGRLPEGGAVLYTYPFLSCDRCAVQMIQAGVFAFVAPKPTADQLTRWGAAFERTKSYIEECGGTWLEYDLLGKPGEVWRPDPATGRN